MRALAYAAAAVLFTACGGNSGGPGPCEADPNLPECLQACDPLPGAPNTCPAGFHCAPDGTCDAQCTQGGSECGSGKTCTIDGECVDDGNDANLGPDADCPDVTFTAEQVIPTVQLLLDKSGSMDDDYPDDGDPSKWDALEQALVGSANIVGNYQASVYFGATLYSETDAGCPDLTPSAAGTGRALNNQPAIADLIEANGPDGGTPTYESLEATYMEMVANPGPADSPPIIILATDGDPYICPNVEGSIPEARMRVVQTAQAAYAAGIRVFVLGLSVNSATDEHLRQVANAGAGQDPVTGTAVYYPADNPTALAAAFDTIIGGVASCDLVLDGDITEAQAAAGTVLLNGSPLMYGTDWTLVGMNTIHLEPGACEILQSTSNPTVTGTFPCGTIIE
jgi:hypothetical protein